MSEKFNLICGGKVSVNNLHPDSHSSTLDSGEYKRRILRDFAKNSQNDLVFDNLLQSRL